MPDRIDPGTKSGHFGVWPVAKWVSCAGSEVAEECRWCESLIGVFHNQLFGPNRSCAVFTNLTQGNECFVKLCLDSRAIAIVTAFGDSLPDVASRPALRSLSESKRRGEVSSYQSWTGYSAPTGRDPEKGWGGSASKPFFDHNLMKPPSLSLMTIWVTFALASLGVLERSKMRCRNVLVLRLRPKTVPRGSNCDV